MIRTGTAPGLRSLRCSRNCFTSLDEDGLGRIGLNDRTNTDCWAAPAGRALPLTCTRLSAVDSISLFGSIAPVDFFGWNHFGSTPSNCDRVFWLSPVNDLTTSLSNAASFRA